MQKLLEQIDQLIICFEEENKAKEDIESMNKLIMHYAEMGDHEFVGMLRYRLELRQVDLNDWQTESATIIKEMRLTDLGQIVLKELQL